MLLLTAGGAHAEVNINTASKSELSQGLKNIGPAKAAAIVEYREMHGAFNSADELAEVHGIGEATLEMNRHLILLENPQPGAATGGGDSDDSGIAASEQAQH